MFKGNNNLAVGLFVSIAIFAFVGFIIWLTGRSGNEEMERYSLMFKKDVSGLAVGGPVRYMGVGIGTVIQMEIVRNDNVQVRVDIEIQQSTPVNAGTFASLAFQGITGVAVINLGSDAGAHEKIADPTDTPYPLIPVRQTGMAAVLSGAPRIVDRLDTLLAQANEMLGEDNRASITRSLSHVETLTGELADSSETIAALPSDLKATLAEVEKVVQQLQGILGDAEPGIQSTLSNLDQTTANLADLTARMDQWMVQNEASLQRFVEEGLGEAPALIISAQRTMRELEKVLLKLQENPSQLIHRPQEDTLAIDP